VVCVFFFSSRRRHTRFSRDWSSDVCSSDLLELGLAMLRASGAREERDVVDSALARLRKLITSLPDNEKYDGLQHAELSSGGATRSEERRVGKEGRSRGETEREEEKE